MMTFRVSKSPFEDLQVEAALLGDLLLDPSKIGPVLSAGAIDSVFTDSRHRLIFAAILAVREAGQTPSLLTVPHHLRQHGHELDVFVMSLQNVSPTSELAEEHARLLIKLQRQREAQLAARELQHLLAQPEVSPEALGKAGALYDKLQTLASSQTRPAGPEVLSLLDLLATPEPQHRYAAAPLIPHPGVTLLVGYSGAFKTWAACSLSLALAAGEPFLGRFGVPRPHTVLFCETEMSRDQLARRFRLLGADPACDRLRFIVGPLDLYDVAQRKWLLEREEEVLILDPAVRLFRGDENAAQDVARFFEQAIFPLKRAGKSVVLVHHVRKAVPGQPPSDPDALIRGSGDWKAAVDAALVLVRQDEQRAIVRHVKARDSREVAPFVLRLDADETRAMLSYEGEVERTLPGLRPVREAVLDTLGEEMHRPDDMLAALRGRYTERVIRETLRVLESEGIVERVRVGRRVLYSRNGHHSQAPLGGMSGEEPSDA